MSGFEVGLVGSPVVMPMGPHRYQRAELLNAAANGASTYWIVDHLNGLFPRSLFKAKYVGGAKLMPKPDAYLEPWTTLGYLAGHNRVSRLKLGTCVTDVGRRNPAVTAQAAVSLDYLSGGRAILGIGTGEREGNEPYGVDWRRPVARFEEALATIRALWDSAGALVNRDSPFFPLHNAIFDVPAFGGKWPPIWVAAHGPRMLRAAGRYGDGWFPALNGSIGPAEYAAKLDAIRSAASDAGRDPRAITPAGFLFVVTGKDDDAVTEALESPVIRWTALLSPDEVFVRHGAQHPMGAGFTGFQDITPFTVDEATALAYTESVGDGVLRDSMLVGTPDQIIEQVAGWRDAGMTHLALNNITMAHRSSRAAWASTIPFRKIMRGLRKL